MVVVVLVVVLVVVIAHTASCAVSAIRVHNSASRAGAAPTQGNFAMLEWVSARGVVYRARGRFFHCQVVLEQSADTDLLSRRDAFEKLGCEDESWGRVSNLRSSEGDPVGTRYGTWRSTPQYGHAQFAGSSSQG